MAVEEEMLLVDPSTGSPQGVATAVLEAAKSGEESSPLEAEIQREQVEMGTEPCATSGELDDELRRWRRVAAGAGRGVGVEVAALATSPLHVDPHLSPTARYERMLQQYGRIASNQLSCGCHVHVDVDSLEEGVGVLDRIGPWLPVLRALTANSPFWHGEDTGYASYRTTVWDRWPSAGPTGPFGSWGAYEQTTTAMLATGALLDEGMIYFDARLTLDPSDARHQRPRQVGSADGLQNGCSQLRRGGGHITGQDQRLGTVQARGRAAHGGPTSSPCPSSAAGSA